MRWLLVLVLLASSGPQPCCGCSGAPCSTKPVGREASTAAAPRGRGCPHCDTGTEGEPGGLPQPCRCGEVKSADLWVEGGAGHAAPDLDGVDLVEPPAEAHVTGLPVARRSAARAPGPPASLCVLLGRFLL